VFVGPGVEAGSALVRSASLIGSSPAYLPSASADPGPAPQSDGSPRSDRNNAVSPKSGPRREPPAKGAGKKRYKGPYIGPRASDARVPTLAIEIRPGLWRQVAAASSSDVDRSPSGPAGSCGGGPSLSASGGLAARSATRATSLSFRALPRADPVQQGDSQTCGRASGGPRRRRPASKVGGGPDLRAGRSPRSSPRASLVVHSRRSRLRLGSSARSATQS
jgi:hypothetical protein